jgi:septum site-determining protein MinC
MKDTENQPVKLKGLGDSLHVTIDPAQPVDVLQQALARTFDRLKHLTINARVVIDPGEDADCDGLIDELGQYLKNTYQVGLVSKPQPKKRSENQEKIREQDIGNEWHHYRSEALIISGRVRSGLNIRARNHLVILGDLNPGAEVYAGGDILVMGSLMGKAAAGQPDNENAIVMALEFKPTQIQIGGLVAAGISESAGSRPEFACVENNEIVVDDYVKHNPFRHLGWPEVR